MAYAWAGPINVCVQEAAQVSAKFFNLGPHRPNKANRAFSASSTTAAAHSSAGYGQGGSSRTESSSWASSLWQLSATLKRTLSPTTSLTALQTAASAVLTREPGKGNSNSATEGDTHHPAGTTLEPPRVDKPKPLLNDFLATSDAVEVNYAALLADLSDKAYDIGILRSDELFETHGLQLVSTSRSVREGPASRDFQHKQQPSSPYPSALAALPETSVAQQVTLISHGRSHNHDQPRLSTTAAAVAHALVSKAPILHHEGGTLTPSVSILSLSSLGGEDSTSSPRSDSGSGDQDQLLLPVVSLMPGSPRGVEAADGSDWDQDLRPHHHLDVDGMPQQMTTAATQQDASKQNVNQALDIPAEWFACDDPVTKIRYLAFQGSTSLEHWQINLQFEPVIFEDASLGVRVHRGVYMAALQMYDDIVPLVRQHLATSPFASVTLTGHSLGGSLASVLMLLLVHRGVLPPDSVSPAYTFGAPAVFCGGAGALSSHSRCHSCGLDCPEAHAAQAMGLEQSTKQQAAKDAARCSHKPKGLFSQLGLGEEHIVNVIMHRDIVPRAFVCDYMAVADLLVSWVPSFRQLPTLNGGASDTNGHKSLYSFLGRVAVIQPDPSSPFVHPSDATHPHLPATPGLYRMVAPAPPMRVHTLRGSFDLHTHNATSAYSSTRMGAPSDPLGMTRPRPYTPAPIRLATLEEDEDDEDRDEDEEEDLQDLHHHHHHRHQGRHPHARRRRTRRASTGPTRTPGGGMGWGGVRAPRTLKQAVLQFMNTPHPLTTLSEYGSYGANGSISRYHNPRNYTLGLLALVGKAPHQQQSRLVEAGVTQSPAPPMCPLPQSSSSQGPVFFDPLSLSPSTSPDILCAMIQDAAMSPEAQRLIRQTPTAQPPTTMGTTGTSTRGSKVDARHAVAAAGLSMSVSPAAGDVVGTKVTGGMRGLVQVPGLSALLSAVGYWGKQPQGE